MLLYSLAGGLAGFVLAVTVDALGWALASPARLLLLGRLSPPAGYARALGLHGACENVGICLGPALASFLWDRLGPAATFQLPALLLLTMGGLAAFRLRRGVVGQKVALQ